MKSKLARQITVQVAGAIFISMLVYAAYQVLTLGESPLSQFLAHLWHTVVLGVIIYGILLWRMNKLIFLPLGQVFTHGNEISKGSFESRGYVKMNNEMDDISGMMNLIADHLKFVQQTSWKTYADSIETHIEQLRDRDDLPLDAYSDLRVVRDDLRNMEVAIMKFYETPARTGQEGNEAKNAHTS